MEAMETLSEATLEQLKQTWTALQLDLVSRAIFDDSDLTFAVHVDRAHGDLLDASDYAQPIRRHLECSIDRLRVVAGLDVSFSKAKDQAVATIAVLSFPNLRLLHSISREISLSAPYIPSFLSMREAQPLVDLIEELRQTRDIPFPQVFLVDGNGRLHERQAGLAVAVGVLAQVPTIGCAKDFHPLPMPDHTLAPWRHSQKEFKARCKKCLAKRGDWIGIHDADGQHYVGAVVLTSPDRSAVNPLYVSAGHRVSLETAMAIALHTSLTARIPEPIRQADAISRRMVEGIAKE